jgi:hypothetical protein
MGESVDTLLMITPNKAKQSQQMPKQEAIKFELKAVMFCTCFCHL